jgi:predicted DsbA family dithiol-disulfide isomerase
VQVEIWSDVVCPWCSIGKRRFEHALERFEHRDDVEVVWRSFELDPTAPRRREGELVDHLARKYGMAREQAVASQTHLTATAAEEGLDFHFERAQGGNTFDAHRLLHLAADQGRQGELEERLFEAYFTEGAPIGEVDTLRRLAVDVGLDAAEVDRVLAGDAFADAVRADEKEASDLGVSGVPFFVVDRRYGVSGAQPADVLLEVLERAWTESQPLTMVTSTDADVACADGSCEV